MAKTAARKQQISETYMGDEHIAEFRAVLASMLKECDREAASAMGVLREEDERPSDDADRSDLSMRKEEKRNLVNRLAGRRVEIEAALHRIESGEYGYCEETGDEIGLPRLRANPLARLCIEAQVRREHLGKLRA